MSDLFFLRLLNIPLPFFLLGLLIAALAYYIIRNEELGKEAEQHQETREHNSKIMRNFDALMRDKLRMVTDNYDNCLKISLAEKSICNNIFMFDDKNQTLYYANEGASGGRWVMYSYEYPHDDPDFFEIETIPYEQLLCFRIEANAFSKGKKDDDRQIYQSIMVDPSIPVSSGSTQITEFPQTVQAWNPPKEAWLSITLNLYSRETKDCGENLFQMYYSFPLYDKPQSKQALKDDEHFYNVFSQVVNKLNEILCTQREEGNQNKSNPQRPIEQSLDIQNIPSRRRRRRALLMEDHKNE